MNEKSIQIFLRNPLSNAMQVIDCTKDTTIGTLYQLIREKMNTPFLDFRLLNGYKFLDRLSATLAECNIGHSSTIHVSVLNTTEHAVSEVDINLSKLSL